MAARFCRSGQIGLEAMLLIAMVALALLMSFPHIRNGINWMWKSGSDQLSGFVPNEP